MIIRNGQALGSVNHAELKAKPHVTSDALPKWKASKASKRRPKRKVGSAAKNNGLSGAATSGEQDAERAESNEGNGDV